MRPNWTRLAAAAPAVVVAGVAASTLAAEFGRVVYFELATHFRLQYALAATLAAAVLLVRKRWAALAVAVVCAAVNWTTIAPYLTPLTPLARAAAPAERVRFMLANVHMHNRDYEALVAAVRAERPDVLVVQELTRKWLRGLAPLLDEYPYCSALPNPGGSGIAVFSRLPITYAEVLAFHGPSYMPGMLVRLRVGETPLTALALHPPTPTRAHRFAKRNTQLAAAAARIRAVEGPRVLIGDLNTTPWSPYFADLVRDSGLRDARAGAGLWTTWPMPLPSPLQIPIDHCLTSDDVRVDAIRTGPDVGSDHRPVVVDVSVMSER
jgi:endonuclease/exonuclease/phosphatase (EEP) superfamily protein YafD